MTSRKLAVAVAVLFLLGSSALAQQTGSIAGKVTLADGQPLSGVSVEARSILLPQPRLTFTTVMGEYRLPLLPPGEYTVEFTLPGMTPESRAVVVSLDRQSLLHVSLGMDPVAESVTVTAENSLIDVSSPAIRSALSHDLIAGMPVGQNYRDLLKLIPSVQYSENRVRGPSAGGNGQDNVYRFDGVDITLPLWGTLSAEPSMHDIAEITVIKGGADATGFNRAGGFTIDSVSKSGTSKLSGQISHQVQTDSMTGEDKTGGVEFAQNNAWTTLNLGGPVRRDRLFFYGSYYRPTVHRANSSTRYGEVPDYQSDREELFGKLTFTPLSPVLLHASYRDSHTENRGFLAASEFSAPTTTSGSVTNLNIGIAEGAWVINGRSFATFKYSAFTRRGTGRPDHVLDVPIAIDGSVRLDVQNLDRQGQFNVPRPIAGDAAYNNFIAPLIERYGFLENGVRTGGGVVGVWPRFGRADLFRENVQVAYDFALGQSVTHDIHLGYQRYVDQADDSNRSNGWGTISVRGGRGALVNGQRVYYVATFGRQTLGEKIIPTIRSEFRSDNFEVNDVVRFRDLTFHLGALLSQDTLFGQGLREDSSTISGYVAQPGHRYKMHQIPFRDMIQPRLAVTWEYERNHSLSASWSRYHPAVNSLPRAASWDRFFDRTFNAFFDAEGNLIGHQPVSGTSGKLFQEGMKPRVIDEYILGTSRQLSRGWLGRAYARHRYASNFWEDTNNNARVAFDPPEGVPRELYIPDLDQRIAQIGSGTNYVIAELDGAFTKFWEVSLESERRTNKTFLRGSYTWSHYYGNFDQDNSFVGSNDQNIFIGSSYIADGPGRQIWNNHYGNLRGDRRHLLKLYGTYAFDWKARAGVFGVYQSGEPWAAQSNEPYADMNASSRFLEPAGSRRSDAHYQVDVNYTQVFPWRGYELEAAVDLFNVTDNQTGYSIAPSVHSAAFGTPREYYDPRRLQVAVRLRF